MKLEQQVCSLDLAGRLQGLGVEQVSYFRWVHWGNPNGAALWDEQTMKLATDIPVKTAYGIWDKGVAAYTVAELLWRMPNVLLSDDLRHPIHQLILEKQATQYRAMYVCANCKGVLIGVEHEKAADALAQAYAGLLENKIITV